MRLMFSAALWWLLLGNGYHLWGASLGVARGACEIECLSCRHPLIVREKGSGRDISHISCYFAGFCIDIPVPMASILEQWRK